MSNVEHVLTVQDKFISDPVAGQPHIRFNDGSVHQLDTGFATSNGLGFSPDGLTLYFVDMVHGKILAYDHNPATGAVENRRIFALAPEEAGFPDGITLDSEGFVWNAHWGDWKVTRYDPSGKIEREIRLPAQNVSALYQHWLVWPQ